MSNYCAKYYIIIILVLFAFAACNSPSEKPPETIENNETEPTEDYIENDIIIVESDPHFRIIEAEEPFHYIYEIYNKHGELVKRSDAISRPMWVEYVSENILGINIGVGIGIRAVSYYSVENDIFSDVFDFSHFIKDELIAYMAWYSEGYKLTIQNIFNSETYLKEFWFEDFAAIAAPSASVQVEYLGNNQIRIDYLSGEDYEESYLILDL